MRLQRIYSSKLYVTSTRKDKIHAAIQDPINAELIQQLSDYLDDTAKAKLDYAVKEETAEETEVAQESISAEPSAPTSAPARPAPGGGSHSFTGDVFKDFGEDEFVPEDPVGDDIGEGGVPVEEPAPAVEESTQQDGQPITAACQIWNTFDDVISDCESIKGTLNSREDTTGVTRLQVKDSELWIYFHDDANLNDKMVNVIEVLNAVGYTYLNFNRLARSNNAIVFDINLIQGPMKTKEEIADEVG